MPRVSTGSTTGTRRAELLEIAAELFATKGFRNTTVRDIADAAGILSGSLYHHFTSKEQMVDEILRTFQDELFGQYDAILAGRFEGATDARTKLEQAIRVSFDAIDQRHSEVAIFQNDASYLATLEGFDYVAERHAQSREVWMTLLQTGMAEGVFRDDLDLEVLYRFLRDSIWFTVNWYRPDGPLPASEVADQYVSILLEGILQKGTGHA